MKEKKKLLNNDIKANRVQLIDDQWENRWEMPLSEALSMAETDGLDLMQIGQNWDLAVVKLLDYGKYLYQKKKQEQKNKQRSKSPEQKTIRISFKISDHDMEIRKKQAEKFAEAGHPLKVTLMLRGRENNYWKLAQEKMEEFIAKLDEVYDIDKWVQRNGSNFVANLKVKK